MPSPTKSLRAVIFDVDGVLVDSWDAHYESWRRVAAEHGVEFTREQFAATFGRTSREIIAAVWPREVREQSGFTETLDAIDERKEILYREIVRENFPAMPGAADLIDALDAASFLLAAGSSGPPENIRLALDQLGKRSKFRAIITGRDVQRGKPDPEIFLLAAQHLGVEPRGCVVIEDAPVGVEAARAAGMKVVALLSTGRRREDFVRTPPDFIVESLADLSPQRLANT